MVKFLNKYYLHLTVLSNALDLQYDEFCREKRKEHFECSGTPLERLEILKSESRRRLNNDYYNHTIDSLIRVFQVQITNKQNLELVQDYRNDLIPAIDEIYNNLQNMTMVDLTHYGNDTNKDLPLPNGWEYAVEKLTESMHDDGYPTSVWLPSLKRIFEDKFVFEYCSLVELYVLTQATLHSLAKNRPV